MSKNIFYQLYSNKKQNYVGSQYVCDNASNEEDTKFAIENGEAVIKDSEDNTIASLDLGSVSDGADEITNYSSETKIIQPGTAYLIQGPEFGLSNQSIYFRICDSIADVQDFDGYLNAEFDLTYVLNFRKKHIHIKTSDYREAGNTSSLCDILDNVFCKYKIPVVTALEEVDEDECTGESGLALKFISNQAGYSYNISNLVLIPIYANEDWPDSPFEIRTIYVSDVIEAIGNVGKKGELEPEKVEDYVATKFINIGVAEYRDKDGNVYEDKDSSISIWIDYNKDKEFNPGYLYIKASADLSSKLHRATSGFLDCDNIPYDVSILFEDSSEEDSTIEPDLAHPKLIQLFTATIEQGTNPFDEDSFDDSEDNSSYTEYKEISFLLKTYDEKDIYGEEFERTVLVLDSDIRLILNGTEVMGFEHKYDVVIPEGTQLTDVKDFHYDDGSEIGDIVEIPRADRMFRPHWEEVADEPFSWSDDDPDTMSVCPYHDTGEIGHIDEIPRWPDPRPKPKPSPIPDSSLPYVIDCDLYLYILNNMEEGLKNVGNLNSSVYHYVKDDLKYPEDGIMKVYEEIIDITGIDDLDKAAEKDYCYPKRLPLLETDSLKYPNGAMRGIVIAPVYPEGYVDSCLPLQLNIVRDNVLYYENIKFDHEHHRYPHLLFDINDRLNLYRKLELKVSCAIQDAQDAFLHTIEIKKPGPGPIPDKNGIWSDSIQAQNDWNQVMSPDEIDMKAEPFLGMYGYLRWVEDNSDWTKFKTMYAIVGGKDDTDSPQKNLVNSIFIFNPNEIPIKVKYLMFA